MLPAHASQAILRDRITALGLVSPVSSARFADDLFGSGVADARAIRSLRVARGYTSFDPASVELHCQRLPRDSACGFSRSAQRPAEHEQSDRGGPAAGDAHGDARPGTLETTDERRGQGDQHEERRTDVRGGPAPRARRAPAPRRSTSRAARRSPSPAPPRPKAAAGDRVRSAGRRRGATAPRRRPGAARGAGRDRRSRRQARRRAAGRARGGRPPFPFRPARSARASAGSRSSKLTRRCEMPS